MPLSDPRDYRLDLSSMSSSEPQSTQSGGTPSGNRPFVSVRFACCNVYTRIYRSTDGSAYRGRCPRCGVAVHFRVGANGTTSRFFTVH